MSGSSYSPLLGDGLFLLLASLCLRSAAHARRAQDVDEDAPHSERLARALAGKLGRDHEALSDSNLGGALQPVQLGILAFQ